MTGYTESSARGNLRFELCCASLPVFTPQCAALVAKSQNDGVQTVRLRVERL